MLMPLASAWPLRSEGIGAGVGGMTFQRLAALAGGTEGTRGFVENWWRMNFPLSASWPGDCQLGISTSVAAGSSATLPQRSAIRLIRNLVRPMSRLYNGTAGGIWTTRPPGPHPGALTN